MRNRLPVSLALLCALGLLAGCSTTADKGQAAQGAEVVDLSKGSGGGQGAGGGGQVTTAGVGEEGGQWTGSPLEDPSSPLSNRTLYFDLDQAAIKPDYQELLRAHAEYLAAHPDRHVTLIGHTDERGSREYNLALGERRAKAVAEFLLAEGVAADQIQTQSQGEESPADPGHDEAAWALNRRVEIVYH